MRLKNLTLKNIGPFKEAQLEFISSEEELENPPVIFFTGENGTGKSIILDAIRTLFMGRFQTIEREIVSLPNFCIKSDIIINEVEIDFSTNQLHRDVNISSSLGVITNRDDIERTFRSQLPTPIKKDFILDYWTSKLSNDSFDITNITTLDSKKYLDEALTGIHKNVDVTKIISFFDYLRDSKNEYEKELGTALYSILEEIINLSITNGKLSHVSRMDLKPIIKISLDKLSSGNLYLIQRFISLLSQVYSICVLNNIPVSEYKSIKGLLLIDEAENHLHPKWQKVFLKNILTLFPKLQIIVSTHSPFIVSSIQNSRVYVCKSQMGFSIVEEETDFYSNKPVEEILMSPLFNTSNFNDEITHLIESRKEASRNKNESEVNKIEEELKQINPEYFDYLNLEDLIKSIKK